MTEFTRVAGDPAAVAALIETCCARIAAREAEVRAWRWFDADRARAEAKQAAATGPLRGAPVGIKDLIDTADMPAGYGSEIYDRHQPERDAACVARLREAGACIFGKTETTEFATFRPAPTRNPHDLARTPGGSSSGSAAAVADRMVPVALGSQTAGSVIRPAAFCGVVGFKPSHGVLPLEGVKQLSPTLDTLGVFARSVADAAALFHVLTGGPAVPAPATPKPPRIGLCHTPHWDRADADTQAALTATAERLRAAGMTVDAVDWPAGFGDVTAAQNTVMWAETALSLAPERRDHANKLSDGLLANLERGAAVSPGQADDARGLLAEARADLDNLFGDAELLLAPSAPGEAPAIETTGDPIFNRDWTALHVPCLTLPVACGAAGLPIGAQFIGPIAADGALLGAMTWIESALSD